MKYWLEKPLGAKWYWFKYGYAVQHGSIHCHEVGKLKSDPNLCELSQVALRGYHAFQSLTKDQLSPKSLLQKEQKVKKSRDLKQKELLATK